MAEAFFLLKNLRVKAQDSHDNLARLSNSSLLTAVASVAIDLLDARHERIQKFERTKYGELAMKRRTKARSMYQDSHASQNQLRSLQRKAI